jgi:hypothetical protein
LLIADLLADDVRPVAAFGAETPMPLVMGSVDKPGFGEHRDAFGDDTPIDF